MQQNTLLILSIYLYLIPNNIRLSISQLISLLIKFITSSLLIKFKL